MKRLTLAALIVLAVLAALPTAGSAQNYRATVVAQLDTVARRAT